VRGHRADCEQSVPGLEQFLQELLRIFQVLPEHDPLLQIPRFLGQARHQFGLPPDQRGDDPVRQLERGGDVQVLLLDPAQDGAGVQEPTCGFTAGFSGPCTVTR
jgi:hypothetical protein